VLGMPDYRMVFIPHPVQLLSAGELRGYAERAYEPIVARITQPPAPDPGAARPRN
jgi:hypothetical protein